MSTTRTGGAAVVETLAARGVDTVFGIPGTHNLELYRHLAPCGIRPVTPRHEQGAGYAAEGYARAGGRPGVVLTTSGPGPTNAMAAAATASAEARADAGSYEEITAAVRAALPPGAALAGDRSQVTYLGPVHFFDVPAPRRFCCTPGYATLGYATLGYGLPAAIGASLSPASPRLASPRRSLPGSASGLARPGHPATVLLGDGAFLFSVQELATAVDPGLPLPVVVVDNGGYREIRDPQERRGIPPTGVDLPVPDLAALARAFGALGVRTTDPGALTALVADALSADRPTPIHLMHRE